jgi:hypothetical protein
MIARQLPLYDRVAGAVGLLRLLPPDRANLAMTAEERW